MAEPSACPICAILDGKKFKVSDMEPGQNAAPMHPHCHCSTAPYVERDQVDALLGEQSSNNNEKIDWIKDIIDQVDLAAATKDDIIELGKIVSEQFDIEEHIGNKEKLKEIFSNFREIGGVVPKESWAKGSSKMVKTQLEEAFSYYPKEWAEIPKEHNLLLQAKKVKHGYFGRPYGEGEHLTIATNGERLTTPYHEIGHMVQWSNRDVVRIEKEWVASRTEGEKLVKLKKIFPYTNYKANEVTKKDNFISPYIGKEYRDATEVLTMGLQGIFVPSEEFTQLFDVSSRKYIKKTILDDKEFLNLVIGLFLKG